MLLLLFFVKGYTTSSPFSLIDILYVHLDFFSSQKQGPAPSFPQSLKQEFPTSPYALQRHENHLVVVKKYLAISYAILSHVKINKGINQPLNTPFVVEYQKTTDVGICEA